MWYLPGTMALRMFDLLREAVPKEELCELVWGWADLSQGIFVGCGSVGWVLVQGLFALLSSGVGVPQAVEVASSLVETVSHPIILA